MSNNGTCLVCTALRAIVEELPGDALLAPAIVKVVLAAYIEGLEDEGCGQRDRFCLPHRARFDVQVRGTDVEPLRFP